MGAYLMAVHLIGVYLTGIHLIGVYLINVHLIGVHLMSVYLAGVHLMGVYPTVRLLWCLANRGSGLRLEPVSRWMNLSILSR